MNKSHHTISRALLIILVIIGALNIFGGAVGMGTIFFFLAMLFIVKANGRLAS